MGLRNRVLNDMLFARDQTLDMLNVADDRIQGGIRRHVYGQAADGSYPDAVSMAMGQMFHLPREQYAKYDHGNLGLIASRSLQAGGVTAAGAGLAKLTSAFAEQFGGSGDQAGSNTLYM